MAALNYFLALLLQVVVLVTANNATLPPFRRAHHSIAILNNFLYIEGGEIATGVGNDSTLVNNTLLAALPRAGIPQNIDTLTFSEIANHQPPPVRDFAFWAADISPSTYNSNLPKGILYRFGGATPNNGKASDANRALWGLIPVAFPGGGNTGTGLWDSQPSSQNAPFLQNVSLTANAQNTYCGSTGVYIGGSTTSSTDVHSQRTSADRKFSSDVLQFSYSTGGWRKSNITAQSSPYASAALRDSGQAVCVVAQAPGYYHIVPTFGGFVSENGSPRLANMSTIHMYDPTRDAWYAQTASGDIPPKRSNFCAVNAGAGSRTDVYVYGGIGEDGQVLDDMYILSFPGFHWFKVPAKSTPRAYHACVAYQGSLLVSGGLSVDGDWAAKDAWPQGLGLFNMSSLTWQSSISGADGSYTSGYTAPKMVDDWYTAGGLNKVKWDDNNRYIFTPDNSNSYNSSGSSASESPKNIIIGGTIGGVALLSALASAAFFYRRRRRARRAAKDEEARAKEYDSDDPPSPTHSELSGDGEVKEAGSDTIRSELDGTSRSELAGTARSELASDADSKTRKAADDDAASERTCVSCRRKSSRKSFESFTENDDSPTAEEDITSQWAAASTDKKMSGTRSIYELE